MNILKNIQKVMMALLHLIYHTVYFYKNKEKYLKYRMCTFIVL